MADVRQAKTLQAATLGPFYKNCSIKAKALAQREHLGEDIVVSLDIFVSTMQLFRKPTQKSNQSTKTTFICRRHVSRAAFVSLVPSNATLEILQRISWSPSKARNLVVILQLNVWKLATNRWRVHANWPSRKIRQVLAPSVLFEM